MKREPVESSMLRAIGYDPEGRTLEVEFTSGQVYEYFDVPPEVHAELLRAELLGHYFLEHVRDAFAYRRLSRSKR